MYNTPVASLNTLFGHVFRPCVHAYATTNQMFSNTTDKDVCDPKTTRCNTFPRWAIALIVMCILLLLLAILFGILVRA